VWCHRRRVSRERSELRTSVAVKTLTAYCQVLEIKFSGLRMQWRGRELTDSASLDVTKSKAVLRVVSMKLPYCVVYKPGPTR
jgi:hypothetical protein